MERIDIYDPEGKRTGKVVSRNTVPGENERFLVVHVCVFNSRGEMLLQQRQLTKDRFPGCWDVSAGGFALSGETPADAVRRELSEELGISASEEQLRWLLREPFSYVLDDFFLCRADLSLNSLRLQEQEVMAAKWAGREEVLQMRASGELVDYDVSLLERLFDAAKPE